MLMSAPRSSRAPGPGRALRYRLEEGLADAEPDPAVVDLRGRGDPRSNPRDDYHRQHADEAPHEHAPRRTQRRDVEHREEDPAAGPADDEALAPPLAVVFAEPEVDERALADGEREADVD